MTPGARLSSAATLLDTLDLSHAVEPQLKAWARANRFAGSGDRRAIADRLYACLRRRGSCAAQGGGETGRALVLGSLVLEDGLRPGQIAELCGGGYGLDPLRTDEAATLEKRIDDDPVLDWPEWLLPQVRRAFGGGMRGELDTLRQRAPLDLRVNTLQATRAEARQTLASEEIDTEEVSLCGTALRCAAGTPITRSKAFTDGLVEPQDAASQRVAAFAGAKPGQSVLDFCAGAGGKTLALAALMENRGALYTHDTAPGRMAPLAERAERAGVTIIEHSPSPPPCDIVFVDAPCSGSGSWRRDPAGKWRLDPARLAALHEAQRDVLAQAAKTRASRRTAGLCDLLDPSERERG